MKKIKITDRWF